ncbi:Na(+)-translocating NADH-quinone reductase subunit F [Anaerohalosphaera lusitana]|uniref:Na(+)-translocating NADH-quinone reductase subunit F n=1 Tax=Anaerohalosphaera lusitana TaxID=1936003 RepID=A0A1U9NMS5_9BACT|nr:ASKHA domain-containing protein [Anaerohalosphaera lusitana]AQT69028.1 Na(+)-translocating NADH-quinone reductase subunit F [Anaerohalosphaera lusitana]
MKHYTIKFVPSGKSVRIHAGATLLEAASHAGIILDTPCGGAGTCGKCEVMIGPERDKALACQHAVNSDMTVEVPKASRFYEKGILTDGIRNAIEIESPVLKIFAENGRAQYDLKSYLDQKIGGRNTLTTELLDQINSYVARTKNGITLVGRKCTEGDEKAHDWYTFEQGDTSNKLFGVAVDLGTTSIVATLFDMLTGETAGVAADANPQETYGADVVSRIEYASKPDGRNQLQKKVVDCFNSLIARLCDNADIEPEQIYEITVAGNTPMHHLLLGLPVEQLGQAPYRAHSTEPQEIRAAELGIKANSAAHLYAIQCISGFVGADTTAVALAVGMDKTSEMTLVIDIGTNGELILGSSDKMFAASCAAGPALEGAKISKGSRAVEGAIEAVVINEDDIDVDVISGTVPRSICGSGLIDALAVMTELGIIDSTGAMKSQDEIDQLPKKIAERITERDGQKCFILAWDDGQGEVYLNQKDIRETQLAKAAIRAGIEMLLKKAGIGIADVEQVLVAGAFGNYIRKESALGIGLLPPVDLHKVHFVGNAASSGAQMALISCSARKTASQTCEKIEYVELAMEMEFQMLFAEALMF